MNNKIKYTKRAAMFGLDFRALRKQFGELFLVRRVSEAPYGASVSSGYTKRAAMFGLDARIALAIFGALSIISGASLYSAIKDAKIEQLWQNIQVYSKALDSYYVDTRRIPPVSSMSSPHDASSKALLENVGSVNNWSGPYIKGEKKLSELNQIWTMNTKFDYAAHFMYYSPDANQQICAASDDYCEIWVYMRFPISARYIDYIKGLDDKIDNGDGATNGSLIYATDATYDRLFYNTGFNIKYNQIWAY